MPNFLCKVCGIVHPAGLKHATTGIMVHVTKNHPECKPVRDFYEPTDAEPSPALMKKVLANRKSYDQMLARKSAGGKKERKAYTKKVREDIPIQQGGAAVIGKNTGFVDVNLPVRIYFSIGSV